MVQNPSWFHVVIGYASAAIVASIIVVSVVEVMSHVPVVVLQLRLHLPLPIKTERVSFQTKRNMRSERQIANLRERKRKQKHDKQRRENMETNQKREAKPREAKYEKQRCEKNGKINHKGQRKPLKSQTMKSKEQKR